MEKNRHWLKTVGIVVVTAAIAAAVTFLFSQKAFRNSFGGEQAYLQALSYAQAQALIAENYIDAYDEEALAEGAMDGLVAALEDRWAYYMTEAEYGQYQLSANNEYSGIGVVIQADEESGGLLIQQVYADSPAWEAGVEKGQIILSIDGTPTPDNETARKQIDAKQGEDICLRLLLPDGTEKEVQVHCGTIYKNPVSYRMLEGKVGYVDIANFDYTVCDAFKAAVEDLMAQGAKALIFDVRFNPGGKVSELTDMLDYLLPEGDVFISRDKNGAETVYSSDAACIDLPMAVLVNANSYSAAEFFAAALEEYGAAVLVGEATTGKGHSQSTYVLPDGSALHFSTRAYFTPKGVNLAETGGLKPEIQVELSQEAQALLYYGQLEEGEDTQLAAAVRALLEE